MTYPTPMLLMFTFVICVRKLMMIMKKNTFTPFGEPGISWWSRITLRSLRVRLALWALFLLGATQAIMAVILYVVVSLWLQNQVDNNLLLTAAQVSSVLHDTEEPN